MQQLGVIFALLCAVAWAFWGVFGKLSTNHGVPPTTLAFLSSCASFVVIVGTYAWQRFPLAPTAAGILYALLSGVCGAIGMLFFSMAIKRGDAAIIVTVSAIYPIFRHCSADSEIAIDRVDDRFYTTGPNLLLLRGAHHVRTG